MMKALLSLALLASAPVFAEAPVVPPVPLTIAQEAALRCSAVFAIVSSEQARHAAVAEGLAQPGLRGREYFVVTTAALMDATSANRQQVAAMFKSRHTQISAELSSAKDPRGARAAMLTPCLALLDGELGN